MDRGGVGRVARTRPAIALRSWLLLGLAASVAGCGGGGVSLIAISPGAAQVLDSGQTLTITASVVNDSTNQGASFVVTGGGTLSAPTKIPQGDSNYVSVTYTAPTVTTATAVTVTATALNTPSQTATVSITVNPALAITTTTLPGGMVGTPYSATPVATGGSAPLSWSVTSGSLPPGIGPNPNPATGALTGTPTTYGTFNFTLSVTDSTSVPTTMSQAYTVTILPMVPTVTTSKLNSAVAGVAYSQQLAYMGGNGSTPTWALVSGTLPAQLTLNPSGLISGTATNASAGATYNITVTVTVGTQTSAPAQLSIVVPALPAVTTTSLQSGNVTVPYSQQLLYSGGAGGTATWAIVSGSLPASSGLTLSSSGLISGTPTLQTTYSFSVAVTVGTQTSAPQAYTLVINNLIVTSSTNAGGEIGLPFSFNLTARGGTPPYTWSLASGSAALPQGLNLSAATGAITGSPTSSAGSPIGGITVKATDTVGGTATQAMTFTISAARSTVNNSELSGQYAFLLSGFDAKGNPLAIAGKFTADGNGNITGGVIDTNGTGLTAPLANASLSATTYAVGADNRGKLTLTSPSSSGTYTIALNNISSGVAGGGYITEFDSSGQSLTGQFALQTPAAFNTPSIANGFAFGMDGFAANNTAAQLVHRGSIGEIQFSGAGGIVSAEYLSTGSGSITPVVPLSGTVSIASNGRGTLSLALPSGGGTVNFVAYVVSSGKLFLLSSDPAGNGAGARDLLYGQALQQTITTGSFNAASLSGISVVRAEKLGVSNTGAYYPDAQVGLYTFNGSGKISLASDENAGGVITSDTLAGTYAVAANGRVTATVSAGLGGCTDCLSLQTYFYLVGSNQGFVLDFSTPVLSGYFQGQTSTGFTAASFSGTYAAGSIGPLAQSSIYDSAALNSTGAGAVTGTEDENAAGTATPDVAVSDTYTVGATGRVALTPGAGGNSAVYIISPTKALQIDLNSSIPTIQELQH
jgi:hypothetical protein